MTRGLKNFVTRIPPTSYKLLAKEKDHCKLCKIVRRKGIEDILKKSSHFVGICEKTAYNYIKRMESRLKIKIISSRKGGRDGGGSVSLTPVGKEMIKRFEKIK